jgi:hypothetical protein
MKAVEMKGYRVYSQIQQLKEKGFRSLCTLWRKSVHFT